MKDQVSLLKSVFSDSKVYAFLTAVLQHLSSISKLIKVECA